MRTFHCFPIALGTIIEKGDEDATVEVCVEHEEELKFGPSQYSQEDLDPDFQHVR